MKGVFDVVYAICIGKHKENNIIVEYKLKDFTNKTMVVAADELKEYIRSGKLTVVNLTLTSNNKLIDFKVKDLDLLKKKEKIVKTREENIQSIVSESKSIKPNGLKSSFIYNNKLFFIDKDNMLCVMDVNRNEHKGICEKVYSVSYVPKGDRMNIFVVIEHNEKYRLKRILFDLDENKVVYSYGLWFLDDGATIGQQAKMTNIGFDRVEERPDYYVGNYKSQFDFVILPVKKKVSDGYIITDIIICDLVREHFYRAKSNIKWFDDFANVLNNSTYHVIPFNTLSNNGSKIFIQTSKMVVILIYDDSRIEFYKD